MFGANTYAHRVRGVHALGLVILFMAGRHPFFLFSSFLLPLKFQFIPTLLEIINSSVDILFKYFVHECPKLYTWNYPILFEIFNSFASQHITKYFVHEYPKKFLYPILCLGHVKIHPIMACETHWIPYCHIILLSLCMASKILYPGFACHYYQSSCNSNLPNVVLWLEDESLKFCSKCLWINHCLHYNLYHWD